MVEFQFPSNGKAYSKKYAVISVDGHLGGFNSLQTGKRIPSRPRKPTSTALSNTSVSIPFKRESVFQVSHAHSARQFFRGVPDIPVSIPFKRESVFQASSAIFRIV